MSRPLKPPPQRRRRLPPPRLAAPPPEPAWPSFTGVATYVGTSPSGRVHVFYDATLGALALANATDLASDADRIVALNDSYFGTSTGEVSVIVFALGGATDGTGGADHDGCDYQTGNAIEVDASFGQSARVGALFEAELSECNMGGNLCGVSTGEGLSRWAASLASGNALSDFATAPTWAADGMPNFVDATDPTDQNPDSTGCTMAFLSWLMGGLGETFATIAQTLVGLGAAGTLADLYGDLTGEAPASAWPAFTAAVQALPFGITTDDPFGGSNPQPAPPPAPPGPTPPPAGAPTLTLDQVVELLTANWPT